MADEHMDKHDDDTPVGRILSRREALGILGGLGVGGFFLMSGCGNTPSGSTGLEEPDPTGSLDCIARPSLTEGPYYVDEQLTRADIRSDTANGVLQAGTPLALTFNVSNIAGNACAPLAGAVVDVWQCNALGVYSDVTDPGFNTLGQDWLRGNLVTDAAGSARFTTIVPGWYRGRATHIHFKVRSQASASQTYEFTSQLFFPESFLSSLYASTAPYTTKGDSGRLRNANDGIYRQGGSQLILAPVQASEGYEATFGLGLDVR